MLVVHILTTTPLAGGDQPFTHAGVKFAFGNLDAGGPQQVLEGAVFAFLDWAMPEVSGLEMCRRMRVDPRTADAHLTMVLESDDPEDRRRALAAGADDYILGPLDRNRVLDRVLVLYDAIGPRPGQLLSQGDLVIDRAAMRARWKGRVIPLAENEFRLLSFLAERPNQVHTRHDLLAAMGKQSSPISERTTDVWMKRLRTGLKEVGIADALRTVRQHGYAFELPSTRRSSSRA